MSVHRTPSDRRTSANYRAEVLRAGFRWPFDGEGFRKGGRDRSVEDVKTNLAAAIDSGEVEVTREELRPRRKYLDLPPYITSTTVSASKLRIAEVLGAVRLLEGQKRPIQAPAVNRVLLNNGRGYPKSSDATKTISRVLYHSGYRPFESCRMGAGNTFTWEWAGAEAVLLPEMPKPVHFPDASVHAVVTPIVQVDEVEIESTGAQPVETRRAVLTNLGSGERTAINSDGSTEDLGVNPDVAAQSVEPDPALVAAEELLREAEELSERRREALERMHQERDAARAEVERLQSLLARERSAPTGGEGDSWSVPIDRFLVPRTTVARLDVVAFQAADLDVLVTFRPKR